MATLLEKAKQYKFRDGRSSSVSDEAVELALAWAMDEIQLRQVGSVLSSKSNAGTYSFLAQALREAFRKDIVVRKAPR